jgi:dienelactone hydrolase
MALLLAVGCGEGDGGAVATTADEYSYEELVQLFDYDRSAPVDLQYVATRTEDDAVVHDVYYTSPKGGAVTAHLVEPLHDGPFAGVVFLHWGQGDRGQFLGEARQLARRGVVSLLMNAPWNCPGFTYQLADEIYIRQVVDARRALDVLASLPDVDTERFGYVGHSNGAVWGGVLAGVERRTKSYVLMAGAARPSTMYAVDVPTSRLDAIHYIGHAAPARLFFQFATSDTFISAEAAAEFFEAASQPKRQEWYDAGHELNARAQLDRLEWLAGELRLEPPS